MHTRSGVVCLPVGARQCREQLRQRGRKRRSLDAVPAQLHAQLIQQLRGLARLRLMGPLHRFTCLRLQLLQRWCILVPLQPPAQSVAQITRHAVVGAEHHASRHGLALLVRLCKKAHRQRGGFTQQHPPALLGQDFARPSCVVTAPFIGGRMGSLGWLERALLAPSRLARL
ncbi:hypothetical protein, partial [Cupriavidus sp. UYPR2.512]|uniref:hypothetical protein n=1 Tax=Cupriavidus sp. UYPR2.512 TaxID=1080187 RepID=UPI001E311808